MVVFAQFGGRGGTEDFHSVLQILPPFCVHTFHTIFQFSTPHSTSYSVQWSGRIFMRRDYVSFAKFSMRPLALGHSSYMEMSPNAKDVMGHSLHQAFSYETFEIWMGHSLHVSPLPKHCEGIATKKGHDPEQVHKSKNSVQPPSKKVQYQLGIYDGNILLGSNFQL